MDNTQPIATLQRTQIEIPRPVRGRPSYVWVEGVYVIQPDGKTLFPPMRIREARKFCKAQGWKAIGP